MSLEEGFGVGFRGGWWRGFAVENKGKGEGVGSVGGGVGTGKGTGKSMRKLCRNYSLANYPLVSPQFDLSCSRWRIGLFFCLRFPPVRKLDLAFFAYTLILFSLFFF